MEQYKSDYDKYQEAKERVKEIKGFYSHLFSYLVVNAFFVFINLNFSPEYLWFFWPMMGWGIGLLFHALGVFEIFPFFGKDWEKKKIDAILEKDKETKKWE